MKGKQEQKRLIGLRGRINRALSQICNVGLNISDVQLKMGNLWIDPDSEPECFNAIDDNWLRLFNEACQNIFDFRWLKLGIGASIFSKDYIEKHDFERKIKELQRVFDKRIDGVIKGMFKEKNVIKKERNVIIKTDIILKATDSLEKVKIYIRTWFNFIHSNFCRNKNLRRYASLIKYDTYMSYFITTELNDKSKWRTHRQRLCRRYYKPEYECDEIIERRDDEGNVLFYEIYENYSYYRVNFQSLTRVFQKYFNDKILNTFNQ